MTRAELEALAIRVEREEPSITLDSDILHAIGQQWTHPLMQRDAAGEDIGPPFFTTSLDAADSLRPEGWHPDVWYAAREQVWRAVLERAGKYVRVTATSPTEARARTAAALRAIAQEARND